MEAEKIQPTHLERDAYVYVRQSTPHQVAHNKESQRRQYELVEHAKRLGFRQVVTIDEDLGRSGSGLVDRPGFGRLLSMLCEGAVGAVLALEASRFARNSRDWHHMIDLCALTGALVIDLDGIYDPRILNDRLLLGLKGSMSEFELGLIRQRAQEALRAMIARGEVLTEVPVGYMRSERNTCEMVPDRQVQDAIRGVFQKFRELGSIRQVLLWYRQERICLPCRPRGHGGRTRWMLPTYSRVHALLKNPVYAGAFASGKTETRMSMVAGRTRKTSGHHVPRERWTVLLRDHHVGYISWEEYVRNQEHIEGNMPSAGRTGTGAAKSGASLLAGLLRCGRCGRKLHVTYSGVRGRVPRYHCRGAQFNHGTGKCISMGGLRMDRAIEEAVLIALQPEGIRASLEAWDQACRNEDEKKRALLLALEKARYEADRQQRQYDAVDPANRLVADELEHRWEVALEQVHELKRRLAALEEETVTFTEAQHAQLLELGSDLKTLWHHRAAPSRLKKRILRTVLKEVVTDIDEEASEIVMRLHWKGGVHTTLRVRKNRTGHHGRATDKDVVVLVRELAKIRRDLEIASLLNRLGYRTGAGNAWKQSRVASLRNNHGIPAFDDSRPRPWCTLAESAERLGVSETATRRLIKAGVLPAKQVVPMAPWMIEPANLDLDAVKCAVAAIKESRRRNPPDPSQAVIPFPSTT